MTQEEALAILKTGRNVFLTGSPGSGKTHTINQYVDYLRSHGIEVAITASTGISATHLGGLTIHSWSGIGIRDTLSARDLKKIATTKYIARRVKQAKVLIIDEISMLSASTISLVDAVCREIKKSDEPFGGLQVVLVGDFFQLPPVIKKNTNREEETVAQMSFMQETEGKFAYDSPAFARAQLVTCYLTQQHRQTDQDFLSILSAIRRDEFGQQHLKTIQTRKIDHQHQPPHIPKLFSYNVDVDRVNNEILSSINAPEVTFPMFTHGPEALVNSIKKGCLSPESLVLKVGAAVMFTKNSIKDGFVNGTLGVVESFDQETNEPIIKTRDGRKITVTPMDWQIEEDGHPLARVTQLPLRLAWAITVHKSQGMSLDAAVMDLSGVFEYGQGYVALSRVRTLAGLHLLDYSPRAFEIDPEVFQKDIAFQKASAAAALELKKLSASKLKEEHLQFIQRCGGREALTAIANDLFKPAKKRVEKEFRKSSVNYVPWNKDQDEELIKLFANHFSVGDLASAFNRTKGSIIARLKKLKVIES